MTKQESLELSSEIVNLNSIDLTLETDKVKKSTKISSVATRLTEEQSEHLIKKVKKITKEIQMLNNYDKESLMIKQNLIPLHGPRQTCSFHVSKNLINEMEQYLVFYKKNSNFSKSDFVNMALFEFIEKYKTS